MNFGFLDILGYVFIAVLVIAALGLVRMLKGFIQVVYLFFYRIIAYIIAPGKMFLKWLGRKLPFSDKVSALSQNSKVTTCAIYIMFGCSLTYLLVTAFVSGDFFWYITNDFAAALPVFSFFNLFLEDAFSSLPEAMASTTIISLCMIFFNKKIEDLEPVKKILFNLAFVIIGWAISQLVTTVLIGPIVSLFYPDPIWTRVFTNGTLPVSPELAIILLPVLILLTLVILYFLLSAFLVALREFFAPASIFVSVFLTMAIVGLFFPNITDYINTFVEIILTLFCFVAYEIWRLNVLAEEEEDINDDVTDNLEDFIDNIKNFFAKFTKNKKQK